MTYVCENLVGPNKTCDFRSGKVILQRPIEREQMNKLLASGKTDLLNGSFLQGEAFKAFLVLNDKKDVGFEFEKREPKAKKGTKNERASAKIDFTGRTISECPISGGKFLRLRPVTSARIHRLIESRANSSSAKRSSAARFQKNRRKSFHHGKPISSSRLETWTTFLRVSETRGGKSRFRISRKTAPATRNQNNQFVDGICVLICHTSKQPAGADRWILPP
jgi:hypothetical protein